MNNPLLFIAGARRSGTSMLRHLLENNGHVLQYPFENSVMKGFYSGRHKKFENYYEGAFINDRREGQQTIMANKDIFDKYNQKLSGEFGYKMNVKVDCDRYKSSYLEYIRNHELNIQNIHYGLFKGLIDSNDYTQKNYTRESYLLFKTPESNEVFAQQTFKDFPNSKFIHIIRHPYDTYCSIKSRRQYHYRKYNNLKPTSTVIGSKENGTDFLTGFSEYGIMSVDMALKNQAAIGPENYFILLYEDLLSEPEKTMKQVADFLKIPFSDAFLRPTLMGEAHKSGSHQNKNTEVLVKKTNFDHKRYQEITSENERRLHDYYLSFSKYDSFYKDLRATKKNQFMNWLRPYKHEAFKHYAWRLMTRNGLPTKAKEKLRESLNNRVKVAIFSPDRTNH